MNRWFINVKVDREQRPDIDHAYMLARQLLSGTGGWPNNVFLTPDLKPFYAGSYYPPTRDEHGRAGFPEVMRSIHEAWTERRQDVLAIAEQLQATLAQVNRGQAENAASVSIDPARWTNDAIRAVLMRFDTLQGGFVNAGSPTKFPQSPTLRLLLDAHARHPDPTLAEALTETLDAIAYGGIHDHLAGGFHRYSVDPDWSVPHFEKMLYDNAQLLAIYARAHAAFEKPLYRFTAERIARYLTTRMMAPSGAFYTAEDAQVDGVEGASYVWTAEQIGRVLDAPTSQRFLSVYALEPLEHSPAARRAAAGPIDDDGAVLRVRLPLDLALSASGYTHIVPLLESLETAREALLAERDRREPPLRDNKLSVDLNGLAIDGFAAAGVALNKPEYVSIAARAAEHLWSTAYDRRNGALYHQVFSDTPSGAGFLTDYALFARGLLSLHAATGDRIWHARAMRLSDALLARFAERNGRLRLSDAARELPIEPQEHGDVAMPSGVSTTVAVLTALAALPQGERYAHAGARVLRAHAHSIAERPDAWPTALTALSAPRATTLLSALERTRADESDPPVLETTADKIALAALADTAASTITITIGVDDGFHINANPASLDYLIPTTLSFDELTPDAVAYPPARRFQPSFTTSSLAVYDGRITIVASFPPEALAHMPRVGAKVTAQACSDTVCLPPSTVEVAVTE